MLRAALSSITAAMVLIPALVARVPLSSVNFPRPQAQQPASTNAEWSLDRLPNPNDADHLVFETVNSLLQHWPNTRMRNGHNIVPGRIPKGTHLYHGRSTKELPTGPEWVSMDPEHSYIFCRHFSPPHFRSKCWHLTLVATRSLKVIYFDGSSAAKLPYGSMDTQDLVAWDKVGAHIPHDEWNRIRDLCKWGKNFGVDGFVRMEVDFEVMLCDCTTGVSMVSFVNLVNQPTIRPMISDIPSFEALNAGSWHNHFPGETRVQLDLAGLISFYDTKLASSLINIRAGQERWDHRVANVSYKDWLTAKSRLEAMLVRTEGTSSGVDWRTLLHIIIDRYAGRLELTRYLLNSTTTGQGDIIAAASKVQAQLRIMLTPYLLSSVAPADRSDKGDLNWTIPVYKLCATTHTSSMESEIESMTDSEKLLLRSIQGTTREICRVVTKMWAAGVYASIDPLSKDPPDISEITQLWNTWTEDLDHLMGWLDWSVWVKCNPGCGHDEMCYLPTWPVGFPSSSRRPLPPDSYRWDAEELRDFASRGMGQERLTDKDMLIVKPGPDDWIRPEPRCLRRTDPYDL